MRRTHQKSTSSKLASKFALATLITVAAGCSNSNDPTALIEQAKGYQQKGDAKAAVIQLKNALQTSPDNPEARFQLGSIYAESGEPLSAEKELRRAVSLGIKPDRVAPLLGKALLTQGQFQKALDETAPAAGVTQTPEILALRGDAFFGLRKPEQAQESFQAAVAAKPDFAPALIGLAKHAAVSGDAAAAMGYADKAAQKDPVNVNVWLLKGDLLRAGNNIAGAIKAYDEAVKVAPSSVVALNDRANAYTASGKYDEAKKDLDAARKIMPNSLPITYSQAVLDATQGNNKAALDSVQLVLKAAPDHMPSILLSGVIQMALGNNEQAEQALKRYIAADPANSYPRKVLATLYGKTGRSTDAMAVLTPALAEAPQDSQLLMIAGESLMNGRQFGKAAEYFEKANALTPDVAVIHTALGMSKLAQGDSSNALTELERATSLDDKSPKSGMLLVMTQLRLKQYDKAMATIETLEKQQPNDPRVQNMKGGVYLGMNNPALARASFNKASSLSPTFFPAVENLARLDLQEKHPEAAKQRLGTFVAANKNNVAAMTTLASVANATGQPQEATGWLEKAAAVEPDAAGPQIELGKQYLRTGAKDKALALAQKLYQKNESNPDVIEFLGQSQALNNDLPAALISFNKLATVKPALSRPHVRIASVHLAMQHSPEAIASLEKALSLQADDLEAQVLLFTLYGKDNKFDAALKVAQQVEKQRPKEPIGLVMQGDLFSAQKKFALAQKSYEQAYALGKKEEILLKLHGVMVASGREKEADAMLLKALNDNPAAVQSRLYAGNRLMARGDRKAAIAQFERGIVAAPQNAALLNNLANAYQLERDPRTLETAEKAYKVAPTNPSVMDTLGWVLVEKGADARGLELLQKARVLVPTNEEIQFHLGIGLMKSGDKAGARKELEPLATSKTFAKSDEAKRLLGTL